ncbi:MAG: YihY/virulence factor BrkB family protein [Candidatus Dormibacteraceae bacterium]
MSEPPSALSTAREIAKTAQRSFPVRLIQKFVQDRGTNQAVLIAWNFLQSLIPIVLILLAVGGYLLSLAGMQATQIHTLVLRFVPVGNETQAALESALNGIQRRSGVFAILALLSFLWSSSNLFGCLEQVLADNYGITPRGFVRQKLMAFAMMLLFCVLAVVAVGSTTAEAFLRSVSVPLVPPWIEQGATGPFLTTAIGIVSGLVLFYAIFELVPKQHPHPAHALPGAIFSGVMFYVLTLVFPLYLQLNKGINRYGSEFAFLFTLLFFFYFLGLITVIGIEINTVLFPLPQQKVEEAPAPAARRAVSRRLPRPLFGLLGAALALLLALLPRSLRARPSR